MSTSIENMIDAVTSGDFTAANAYFDEVMAEKAADTLEAEKVGVASRIYGHAEEDDQDDEEDDEEEDEGEPDEDE
jgi:hypothetical protein